MGRKHLLSIPKNYPPWWKREDFSLGDLHTDFRLLLTPSTLFFSISGLSNSLRPCHSPWAAVTFLCHPSTVASFETWLPQRWLWREVLATCLLQCSSRWTQGSPSFPAFWGDLGMMAPLTILPPQSHHWHPIKCHISYCLLFLLLLICYNRLNLQDCRLLLKSSFIPDMNCSACTSHRKHLLTQPWIGLY